MKNGRESLSRFIRSFIKPELHILSLDEAKEIRALGVTHMYILNINSEAFEDWNKQGDKTGFVPATGNTYLRRVEVAEGLGVLMVGAGNDGSDWVYSSARFSGDADTPNHVDPKFVDPTDASPESFRLHADPSLMYRILLGVGRDSGLVKDEIIKNAAHSPGNTIRSRHVIYNDYIIALPRLRATVRRLLPSNEFGNNEGGEALPRYLAIQGVDTGSENRFVDLTEIQEAFDFATISPEGTVWPSKNDGDSFWRVFGSSSWADGPIDPDVTNPLDGITAPTMPLSTLDEWSAGPSAP